MPPSLASSGGRPAPASQLPWPSPSGRAASGASASASGAPQQPLPGRLILSNAGTKGRSDAVGDGGAVGFSLRPSSVGHVRQVFNWDCGLACVLMVLRGLGVSSCDLTALHALCPTQSIWTVDLAHLLRRFSVDVLLLTVTIGANPEFARESFYADTMPEDEWRVERLFRDAADAGIAVQCRSLSAAELRTCVASDECYVIALVDKWKLPPPPDAPTDNIAAAAAAVAAARRGLSLPLAGPRAETVGREAADIARPAADAASSGCPSAPATSAAYDPAGGWPPCRAEAAAGAACVPRPLLPAPRWGTAGSGGALGSGSPPGGGRLAPGYTGHYVILAGYDPSSCTYLLRDPASTVPQLSVPADAFEAARRSFGTDEDLLIVPAKAGRPAADLLEALLGPAAAARC